MTVRGETEDSHMPRWTLIVHNGHGRTHFQLVLFGYSMYSTGTDGYTGTGVQGRCTGTVYMDGVRVQCTWSGLVVHGLDRSSGTWPGPVLYVIDGLDRSCTSLTGLDRSSSNMARTGLVVNMTRTGLVSSIWPGPV